MTREGAKKAAEVMLAFADGKEVEFKDDEGTYWPFMDKEDPCFDWQDDVDSYRIKPEPHYRPFKSAEECWQEMQKHQPFGWVRGTFDKDYVQIQCIINTDDGDEHLPVVINFAPNEDLTGKLSFEHYVFADGTPFGMMEE